MKKKLSSLLIVALVLVTCAVMPLGASAEIAVLEPFEFTCDFEDEAVLVGEGYTDAQITEMTGMPLLLTKDTPASQVSASVIQDAETGNKMLKLFTSANGDQIDSLYTLSSPLVAGKLEATYEFMPDAVGSGAWHMLSLNGAPGKSKSTISYNTTGWAKTSETSTDKFKVSPQKDANGKFKVRLVAYRSGSADPWKVEVYDDLGETPVLCYEGETAADFGSITSVKPIRLYAINTGWNATFDNYGIKVTSFPAVLEENDGLNGAAPDAAQITIGFNGAIPNPDDNVTIVKKTDPTVVIDVETDYNAEIGVMTVSPGSFLEYGTEYELKFENGGVANHTFTTKAPLFGITSKTVTITQGGETLDALPEEGTFDVSYSINVANAATGTKFYDIVFIAYSDENAETIISTNIVSNLRLVQNTNRTTNKTISGLDASKVKYIEVLVWEKVDGIGYRLVE